MRVLANLRRKACSSFITALYGIGLRVATTGALLEWEHRDPADRWIVALAEQRDCPIVTSDERIRAFHENTIW
jgi:PIN domain nuclease of toxin-antitoxin system